MTRHHKTPAKHETEKRFEEPPEKKAPPLKDIPIGADEDEPEADPADEKQPSPNAPPPPAAVLTGGPDVSERYRETLAAIIAGQWQAPAPRDGIASGPGNNGTATESWLPGQTGTTGSQAGCPRHLGFGQGSEP